MKAKFILNQTHPTWEFDLTKFDHYSEILKEMRELEIVDYVYSFVFNGVIVKHGYSAPEESTAPPGERIYRQSGNLNGWSRKLRGPSGKDMADIDQEYFNQTGNHLNRNGMTIIVRDMTGMTSPSITDSKWHVKQLERKLIKDHIDQFGKKPVGNIKDESHIDNKPFISGSQWHSLFEVENA